MDAQERFSIKFYDCCEAGIYGSSPLYGAIKLCFLIRSIKLDLLRIYFGSEATDICSSWGFSALPAVVRTTGLTAENQARGHVLDLSWFEGSRLDSLTIVTAGTFKLSI